MKSIWKPILIAAAVASLIGIGSIAYILTNVSRDDAAPVADIIPGSEPPYNFDYRWAENHPYIAHAFGGILGQTYTNSYEAFLLNYQLGHRVFEVDFFLTDDGRTVAAHDDAAWRERSSFPPDNEIKPSTPDHSQFTYDNFMSSLWYDQFHPVDLNLLFRILQDYPDIYIVTDTKFTDEANVKKQFTAFVNEAQKVNSSLLNRFIVQIYSPGMLAWIMDIYPWKSVIYTLYQTPNWTPENILAFSETSGVKLITMWDTLLTSEISDLWKPSDIKIATHTLNNATRAADSRRRGANLIYTDFLIP